MATKNRNRTNKTDRLLDYSCNPINWGNDFDGVMWDRYNKNKRMINLKKLVDNHWESKTHN